MILTSSLRKFKNDIFEEQVLKLPLKDVSTLINWDSNREPDESKVNEIIQSIKNHKFSPQIIATFAKNDNFIIYDGGHRAAAYNKMLENQEDSKILQEYFSDSIIISVIIGAPIRYIVDRFKDINKSTPLPELYKEPLENNKEILRKLVPKVIIEFKKVYKNHKTSNRPQLPSYNPGALTDLLFDVLNSEEILNINENVTVQMIMNVFAVINSNYKNELLQNPTRIKNGVKLVTKAEDANNFIFLKDWSEDFTKIFNRLANTDLIDV